jgi:integral membrane protein
MSEAAVTDSDTRNQTRIRKAVKRYRVMAIVTGTFLLLVCVDMIIKYGGLYVLEWENQAFLTFSSAVAIIHGWIYVVYLVTCIDLWQRMKWSVGRAIYMALGGVVPMLSFFAERRIASEVADSLDP